VDITNQRKINLSKFTPYEVDLLIFIFTLDLKKESSEIYSNYEQISLS